MRTYSEQDVAAIIARAAERQAAAARTTASVGLTLDEIERLGQDAGLDPADLRAAAAEIDAAGRTLSRQASQTKTQVVVERWIDAPLTLEGWENTVYALRERLGVSAEAALGGAGGGTVQQVGAAFEWTHTSGLGVQTVVTASPRGERTRLRMSQLVGLGSPRAEGIAYGTAVALILGGIALVAGVKLDVGALAAVLATLAVFAASLAIAIPATTALDRRWRAGKLRALDALADDLGAVLAALALEVGEPIPNPVTDPAPAETRAPTARLDLGALGDAPDREASDRDAHRPGSSRSRT